MEMTVATAAALPPGMVTNTHRVYGSQDEHDAAVLLQPVMMMMTTMMLMMMCLFMVLLMLAETLVAFVDLALPLKFCHSRCDVLLSTCRGTIRGTMISRVC